MIPVSVDQLFLSNMGFVVILKPEDGDLSLPIFIGAAEAQSIAIQMNGVSIPRPLTHDLLKNVLDYLECRLLRVEVTELIDGTYFAQLVVEWEGRPTPIDCRPSDGIALGLRCAVPIFVAEKVMKEAAQKVGSVRADVGIADGKREGKKRGKKSPSRPLTPLEVLKDALTKAVEEERYEDAARYRDEIEKLERSHTDN